VTRPPTLDGWIDDTLDIIETLKMPVYLLGVSLGTWVMGRVATHAPEFIKGLVLQGATLGFENGQEAVIQRRREFSADGMVAFARKYARTTLVTDNDVLIEGLGRILAETPPNSILELWNPSTRLITEKLFPHHGTRCGGCRPNGQAHISLGGRQGGRRDCGCARGISAPSGASSGVGSTELCGRNH